jgi:hypothetical protein
VRAGWLKPLTTQACRTSLQLVAEAAENAARKAARRRLVDAG